MLDNLLGKLQNGLRTSLGGAPLANATDSTNLERAKKRKAKVENDKQEFYNEVGSPTEHRAYTYQPPGDTFLNARFYSYRAVKVPVKDIPQSTTPSPRPSISSFPVLNAPRPGTEAPGISAEQHHAETRGTTSPPIDLGETNRAAGNALVQGARELGGFLHHFVNPTYNTGNVEDDLKQLGSYCHSLIDMINQVTSQLDTSTSDYDIMQTVHNAINDIAQLVNKLNRPGAAQSKETHLAFRSLDVKFNRHLTMFIAVCQKLNLQQRTTDTETILQVDPAVLQRQVEATTGKTLSASVLLKGVVEYRGRSTLGGGGLKTDYQVFRGRLKSGESVALKTHLQSSKNDGDGVDNVRRIMRQVHLWTSFSSPYILECYGVGMEITMTTKRDSYDDFKLYLVSPYMRNGDAASFVSKRRRLGAHVKLLQLIRDIALGIQYLHHRTPDVVVHASVRGENVLIKDDESACLGGFCLSKVVSLETATALTGNNFQCRWMAPELFRKPRQLAAACDVWSWAMTALELISGQEPYYSIRVDWEVVDALKENQKPERGQHAKFDQYCPLADLVWALMEKCWLAAAERPTIDEVVSELERIEDIYAGQQLTASWS